MSLEKKLRIKYKDKEYEKTFSSDFTEAVSKMDQIVAILSRKEKKEQES
jgi:hypothetical protein